MCVCAHGKNNSIPGQTCEQVKVQTSFSDKLIIIILMILLNFFATLSFKYCAFTYFPLYFVKFGCNEEFA